MSQQQTGKISLFLMVRTHSQLQYYLKLAESRGAANDSSVAAHSLRVVRQSNVIALRGLRLSP